MTSQPATVGGLPTEEVEARLIAFLNRRLNTVVPPDQDLFATGLVNSMFAMELIVHIEQVFAIAVVGPDLRLDNFRTVTAMTALVQRLADEEADDDL